MDRSISTKTLATGGTGGAVGLVLAWVLSLFGVEMPEAVAVALGGLVAAAGAAITAYCVPAKSGKYVVLPDTDPAPVDPTPTPDDDPEPAAAETEPTTDKTEEA